MSDDEGRQEATVSVANISVKLTPFWPSDPRVLVCSSRSSFYYSSDNENLFWVCDRLVPRSGNWSSWSHPEATGGHALHCPQTAASECRLQQLFNSEKLGATAGWSYWCHRWYLPKGTLPSMFNACPPMYGWFWPPLVPQPAWKSWPNLLTKLLKSQYHHPQSLQWLLHSRLSASQNWSNPV